MPDSDLHRLTGLLRDFAHGQGLPEVWQDLGRFTTAEFVDACRRRCGYQVRRGNRGRMLRVLLDLAGELGWLQREGGTWGCAQGVPAAPGPGAGQGGEVAFFGEGLRVAARYLRGGDGFSFDAPAESLWDGFLAAPIYAFGRRWLLRRVRFRDAPGLRCLDVGYGTGRSTLALCERFPCARKVALDAHGSYRGSAQERVQALLGPRADTVEWVPPRSWPDGFAGAIPGPSGSFDLVFLSCGEPYVPVERRQDLYREVHRILKPGGQFLILTWAYPDLLGPADPALRRRALLHDFVESVCRGWHGFVPSQATGSALRRAGFRGGCDGGFPGLQGAGWLAEKEGRA